MQEKFKAIYAQYWDMVKESIDAEGWVYVNEVPHLLDSYFEHNTGHEIEYQKSSGPSGDNPNWYTRGARWRPKSISDLI